ncbi:Uu.00g013400.m01.CDS01 [Anthostomella pinea]|uniref:Uu.00g013400.m01.CDS01 n=1 Tax=Anthostomella pinea TaxID=933095 RepID=A0AAI8YQC7_9PEZI|nr:Uu.00g013400.m01.CDS01 [Anthostomella pinea]
MSCLVIADHITNPVDLFYFTLTCKDLWHLLGHRTCEKDAQFQQSLEGIPVLAHDDQRIPILHHVIETSRDIQTVEKAVKAFSKVFPGSLDGYWREGFRYSAPLITAITLGRKDIVEMLLDHGANIDIKVHSLNNPTHQRPHTSTTHTPPEVSGYPCYQICYSTLTAAIRADKKEIAELLVARGLDLDGISTPTFYDLVDTDWTTVMRQVGAAYLPWTDVWDGRYGCTNRLLLREARKGRASVANIDMLVELAGMAPRIDGILDDKPYLGLKINKPQCAIYFLRAKEAWGYDHMLSPERCVDLSFGDDWNIECSKYLYSRRGYYNLEGRDLLTIALRGSPKTPRTIEFLVNNGCALDQSHPWSARCAAVTLSSSNFRSGPCPERAVLVLQRSSVATAGICSDEGSLALGGLCFA